MIERRTAAARRAERYDEMAFSQVLFRYIWPFWLFKDASRGDRIARAAAYRHNRSMRIYLPAYLVRWMLGSAFAFAMTATFDSLAVAAERVNAAPANVFTFMAASGGIMFAGSLCVLLVTSYVYLYLGRHDA